MVRGRGSAGTGARVDVDHRRHGIPQAGGTTRSAFSVVTGLRLASKAHQLSDGVSLSVATRNEYRPIDFSRCTSLPWTEDAGRRQRRASRTTCVQDQARSRDHHDTPPSKTRFRAKSCLPIALRRLVRPSECHPHPWFRLRRCRQRSQQGGLLDAIGRRRGEPGAQLGVDLGPKAFRRITWREGNEGLAKEAELPAFASVA